MQIAKRTALVAMIVGMACAFGRTKSGPVQQASLAASQRPNPYEGQQDAQRAGAKLYQRECAACHGAAALGVGRALPLASSVVRDAPPGALFWVLRNGSIWRGMPSFSHLPEQQRWQIVTYLKSL
jgi:mono/diheme cytochrome c family protein